MVVVVASMGVERRCTGEGGWQRSCRTEVAPWRCLQGTNPSRGADVPSVARLVRRGCYELVRSCVLERGRRTDRD